MNFSLRGFVCIFIVIFVFMAGCFSQSEEVPADSQPPADFEMPSRGFLMGFLPTLQKGQSLADAYQADYCEFVPVWGKPTPFYDMADVLSGSWGKTFLDEYIRGNGMIPLIHISFIDAGVTLKTLPGTQGTLADLQWREMYKDSVLNVVQVSNPQYLSVGNEVNRWFEKYGTAEDDPNGFQHFVSLYEEIYDEVKEISPRTIVFCTFAREIVSENREANLDVLRLFNPQKMDILVFTSYPHAVQGIMNPSDIPDDYYERATRSMPHKPVGFSEVGWPSLDAFGGEQGQADFLRALKRLTIDQGIDLYFLGWPWLCDLNENDTMGLIRKDGTQKEGYRVWKVLFTGEEWDIFFLSTRLLN